jgi:hypothetical protein
MTVRGNNILNIFLKEKNGGKWCLYYAFRLDGLFLA